VEQGRYGHPARKATWLYAVTDGELPVLKWGMSERGEADALVSWSRNHVREDEDRPRVGKKVAAATPVEFRDKLLDIASGSRPWRGQDGKEIPKSARSATPPEFRDVLLGIARRERT
jgi:hypothetical protein